MQDTKKDKIMKKLVVGILAHVDAGKTTLSEGLLYTSGKIRKIGRVDNKDAYLDTNQMEKERGITIFSKQAVFEYRDLQITLLDTPGHVDFSSEMERMLQVLDYAILVVNGADGVQAHTKRLWSLLRIIGWVRTVLLAVWSLLLFSQSRLNGMIPIWMNRFCMRIPSLFIGIAYWDACRNRMRLRNCLCAPTMSKKHSRDGLPRLRKRIT